MADNEVGDRTFNEALGKGIEEIAGSDAFVSLFSASMADFLENPWPSIQLAIAILLDKPIIIACLPGREVPGKLAAIADKIIYGPPDDIAIGIERYLRKHERG